MAIKSGYTAEDLARLGPDALTRKRLLAEAMLNDSTKQRKIAHPLQGFQQLAETLVNGLDVRKLDNAEKIGREGANSAWGSLLSSMGDGSSSMPAPGAAGEMSATAPSFDGKPVTAKGEVADYIRQSAAARGIDPDIALRVAMSEGGVDDPVRQSLVVKNGVREPSYGPFQLYMGGGLGNKALSAGIDPRDPSQWKQGVDFALDQAKTGGWGPWYGAKKLGITGMMGIGNSPSQAAAAPTQVAPNQVASLDPSAGMPMPGATGQMRASDPAQPIQQPDASPLPAPVAVSTPPVPPNATAPNQQVAQALIGGGSARAPSGPDMRSIAAVLTNPWATDEQKGVASMIIRQQQARQQADYEQQLKMSDPKYRQDLEKGGLEIENLRNPKMSPAEQQRIELERQKFDYDRNKPIEVNGRLIGPDGKVVYESPRDPMKVGAKETVINPDTGDVIYQPAPGQAVDFNDVSGLRKEIQQLPSYKNLSQALPIYQSMAETAGRNSKASDLNLVYGLGKIMDPTSVVREGEMVMVKNTASLPDWLQGAIASLNGGAALTPETRQAIMTEAYGRVQGYDNAFKQDTTQYQGIVERNKFNPADVIPSFGAYEPWKAPSGVAQPKTQDDFNALPSGTEFIAPDGTRRRKP